MPKYDTTAMDAFLSADDKKAPEAPAAAPSKYDTSHMDAFLADDAPAAKPAEAEGQGGGSAVDEGESEPKHKKPTGSQLMAAVRGTVGGSTSGFGDEAYGLLGAAANPTDSKKEFWDRYTDSRDYARNADKKARAEYPATFKTGELAGGLGAAVTGMGAGQLATSGVKGATALGALSGLGNSEADLTKGKVAKAAGDTALGAGVGLGAGVLFGGLSNLVSGEAAAGANTMAEDNAARALGMTKAIRNKIGNERARAAGRAGLDEDVITPLASTEDKLAGMQGVQERAGQKIGDTVKSLDESGAKEFNPLEAASKIDEQIGNKYGNEPLFKSQAEQYQNLLDTVLKRGDKNISFSEAQKLKELLGQYGYKEGNAIPGREQAQQAYGIINKYLDDSVGKAAADTGDAGILEGLQGARKTYGAASDAIPALENRSAAEAGNKPFGLTDTIMVAPKIMTNPATAVAELGAKKAAERYGSNIAAVGLDKVAKLLQVAPDALGPYAGVLANAAQKGSQALAAAHAALLKKDPKYAEMLDAQGK